MYCCVCEQDANGGLEVTVWGLGFGGWIDPDRTTGASRRAATGAVARVGGRLCSTTLCVATTIERSRDPTRWCVGSRKVDTRLPGKANSHSHGVRPAHYIISMIKWMEAAVAQRDARRWMLQLIPVSNRLFQVLDWYWLSPEFRGVRYKSRQLKKTICSHSEGWWNGASRMEKAATREREGRGGY